jgi:hypothetical protein
MTTHHMTQHAAAGRAYGQWLADATAAAGHGRVMAVAGAPDGRSVVAAAASGAVVLFSLPLLLVRHAVSRRVTSCHVLSCHVVLTRH